MDIKYRKKKFFCEICGTSFKHECDLKSHRDIFHKNTTCASLQMQHSTVSEREKPLIFYENKSDLKSHGEVKCVPRDIDSGNLSEESSTKVKLVNSEDKPMVCHYCGKQFRDLSAAKVHLKTHADDRHFACDICGKLFKNQNSLILHKRWHTGEKPFACDGCGKHYSSYNSLNYHIKYRCKRNSFPSGNNGKQSDNLHKKSFNCDICGKVFKTHSGFTQHCKKHFREGPFA